jgi:CRISPR-associated protein Cst2
MTTIHSLAISARVTLDLHNLNSEGTEGNQQQTRMVHIIDQNGNRAVVNAVSGDMFKHMLVEHLTPLLAVAGQPLSPGARAFNPDRINAGNLEFEAFCKDKSKNSDTAVLTRVLSECSVTDTAGTLVTLGGRAVGRKSVVEFGWVVGLPFDEQGRPLTTTEQYFHVKYAPEGRGASTGGETVAGTQAIFHRPASSGVYALICNLDLYRIGLNDISREYVIGREDRTTRAKAVIQALIATLLKPSGAQRNTQAPHVVACEGVVSYSSTSLPAPLVSPLNNGYRDEITGIGTVLNRIAPETVAVQSFDSLKEGADILVGLAEDLNLPEGVAHGG